MLSFSRNREDPGSHWEARVRSEDQGEVKTILSKNRAWSLAVAPNIRPEGLRDIVSAAGSK